MDFWQDILSSAPQIGGAFGVGTGPFVLAILSNKLRPNGQFVELQKQHDKQAEIADTAAKGREALLQAELARAYEAKTAADAARDRERERADLATSALADLARESGASMVHLLQGLRAPDGGPNAGG
jgi:CRP-like cAMP-binding protein